MENQPVTPAPGARYLTGAKGTDILLGVAIALAWWGGGAVLVRLAGQQGGAVFLGLLAAYAAQELYLARKPKGHVLGIAIFAATLLAPFVVALGMLGMCMTVWKFNP